MTCASALLLLAACGGEEAVTFRKRNAADWSARLTDPDTRVAAFLELRKGGVDALPVLIVMLRGDDLLAALAAGDMIGGLGPRAESAVPALAGALEESRLRGMAATALGRIGRVALRALNRLRGLMGDPESGVSVAAAFACWRIAEDPEAILILMRGLDSGSPGPRRMAVSSLGRVGKPAVDALIAALSDENPIVRAGAADALGAIGPDARKARRALYETLKDESAIVRKSAEAALEELR